MSCPCAAPYSLAFDAAPSHCSGNVALPWQELSNWSEKIVLTTLPRHQILRKRGCAAGVNNSFTHSDEMERRRYTDAPAFWCCVSAEPGGVLVARRCARLPAGSPVLRALCTDRSMCERRCSARAAKVDSLHYLLAAGRAGCPAAARPAALCVGQHVPRCDCQRSNSRDRTPRSS